MYKTPDNEKIKILGKEVLLVLNTYKCNKEEADGLYESETIYLKDYYESEEEYKRILIHESFHALCEILGCQLDIHMEETLAHTVSKLCVEHFI